MARDARFPKSLAGCTLLVAAAGYGKTTALEAVLRDGQATYRRASDLESSTLPPDSSRPGDADVSGRDRPPGGDLPTDLLVDDWDDLCASAQVHLARRLATGDARRVWLASRQPISPEVRRALGTFVRERGPAELALSPPTVARILRDEHGIDDVGLVGSVVDATAGWPLLVHFAGDAFTTQQLRPGELLDVLAEPGTPCAAWVAEHLLGALPPAARSALELALDIEPLCRPLLVHLADQLADHRDGQLFPARTGSLSDAASADPGWSCVEAGFDALWRTGVLTAHPHYPRIAGAAGVRLVPVVAEVARRLARGRRRPPRMPATVRRIAAAWFEVQGSPRAAAELLPPGDDATRLVEARAEDILGAGGAAEVVRLLAAVPPQRRSRRASLVLGDALRVSGNVPRAARVFSSLLAEFPDRAVVDAALAWRAAMAHYVRAEYRSAVDMCDRADVPSAAGQPSCDDVLVLACRAAALHLLGDVEEASRAAVASVAAAEAIGDERCLAAANIAAAATATGSSRDDSLVRAHDAAERAGDVVLLTRVLTNQAHVALAGGRYAEAERLAASAVASAELGSPPGILVTAIHNLGEALLHRGRYDDATYAFQRSVLLCRRAALQRTGLSLRGLAEVHRRAGRYEQALTAYEEAVTLARATGECQVLVPALTGLCQLLLERPPPELTAADALAEEAVRVAPDELRGAALLARARVMLRAGDRGSALAVAAECVVAARQLRQGDRLAEALEVYADANDDVDERRAALIEALAVWESADAEPAADRVRVLLGRLPRADGSDRAAARAARMRLVALGISSSSPLLGPDDAAPVTVEIRVLGTFDVRVAGVSVPLTAWRSRQARTLLKLLVARRGRHASRDEVCEVLWPDDEPRRTAHRLSVLLSAVRGVLDPDRAWPQDHFIRADAAGMSLDLAHVRVDAVLLLEDARLAATLARAGDVVRARDVLVEVDRAYRGDALADEAYEDWADGVREEVRAAWQRSARELAGICRREGEEADAAAHLVRLIGADPYDERAHRELVEILVQTGRHGEAQRRYRRWADAMRAIGAPEPEAGALRPLVSGPLVSGPLVSSATRRSVR